MIDSSFLRAVWAGKAQLAIETAQKCFGASKEAWAKEAERCVVQASYRQHELRQ